jgi:hypothetical protein
VSSDVLGGAGVLGVPEDDEGVDGQAEGDGAFHGAGGAVTGLADAEDLPHLGEDHFDGPAGGVGADDLLGGGVQVGGDQGQAVDLFAVSRSRIRRTGRSRQGPYHWTICSARWTSALWPYRWTVDGFQVARAAIWVRVPSRSPFLRGRPRLPVGGGGGLDRAALAASRVVQVTLR